MANGTHHVVHNPNGGWDVKRGAHNVPVDTMIRSVRLLMLEGRSARIRELSYESMGLTEEFNRLTAMGMIHIHRKDNR